MDKERESEGDCVIRCGVQLMRCFLKQIAKSFVNRGGWQIFWVKFSVSYKRYFRSNFFIPEFYFIAGYKKVQEPAGN